MKIEQLFFQLLQVAIGNKKTLSVIPSKEQWAELFTISKKQALTAIAFAGVNKLIHSAGSGTGASDYGASLGIPEVLYLKWLGLTAKVAQRNRLVNEACVELVGQLAHDGLKSCILKGQSNLVNYPEDLRECRTAGDIDIWVQPMDDGGIDIAVGDLDGKGAHYARYHGKQAVVEYVKMLHRIADTEPTEGVRYHHIDAPSINTSTGSAQVPVEVEAHFRPLFLDSPMRNWRMQRWFKENEQFGVHDTKIGEYVIPTPAASFNAVYQLAHIYRHLFDEGIGLRQLLDYYFVLRALHIEQGELADRTESMAQWAEGMGIAVKSDKEIMHTLGRFGMKKFAGAVMYVLAQVFDPRVDIKTKTIKTPEEAASACASENSSELDSSATQSSATIGNGVSTPSGDKQEKPFCGDEWKKRWPWMICKPNEKEGKFLLNEIMMAGNFGKYDERIDRGSKSFMGFKVSGSMAHAIEKTKHNLRLLSHYPEEVLSEPFFRLYHWIWRRFELWRY